MKKHYYLVLAVLFVLASCTQKQKAEAVTPASDSVEVAAKTTTVENLKAAIIGETTASAKYAAFAKKAKEEGFNNVAALFNAASKAEEIHATNHTKVLEGMGEKMDAFTPEFEVKTTAENLQVAIDGETHEFTSMYPEYIETAKAEGNDKAVKSFTWAMDTEKKHEQFYQKALTAVNAKSDKELAKEYFVCPVCGNTYEAGNVEKECGFCMTPQERFISVK